jgi:hypothetical protein
MNKGIKVLLTSGYAGDVLERHRAVDEFPIIDKPFRLQRLGAASAVNPARSVSCELHMHGDNCT